LTVVRASPTDHNVFALAGKEIEVSLWDLSQTFAEGAGDGYKAGDKRKKDEKEVGEIWRAKNVGLSTYRD
jgi:ribosome biogenesis protein NSA1